MVREGRDAAERHKYGAGKESCALECRQFMELEVCALECSRGLAQGAPAAIEVGCKIARVGDEYVYGYPALLGSLVSIATMVKPRQRLISRRGSGRGGTSRPSVDNASTRCCRCLCHRVEEANPLQSSQFMDSGNPEAGTKSLPAFGTAVFSFNSAPANSRINAHVSVLFMEEPVEEVEEQPRPQLHQAESSRAAEGLPEDSFKPDLDPPASQEVPPSGKAKVDWGPPPEGTCWIYEEEPED